MSTTILAPGLCSRLFTMTVTCLRIVSFSAFAQVNMENSKLVLCAAFLPRLIIDRTSQSRCPERPASPSQLKYFHPSISRLKSPSCTDHLRYYKVVCSSSIVYTYSTLTLLLAMDPSLQPTNAAVTLPHINSGVREDIPLSPHQPSEGWLKNPAWISTYTSHITPI